MPMKPVPTGEGLVSRGWKSPWVLVTPGCFPGGTLLFPDAPPRAA